jgi:hypothetical protein
LASLPWKPSSKIIHCHVATLLTSHAKRFQRNPVLVTAFDKEISPLQMHKKLSSKNGLKIILGWVLPEGTVLHTLSAVCLSSNAKYIVHDQDLYGQMVLIEIQLG